MIDLINISAGYPGQPVLQDLSLHCPTGKITVLAGPNGCGKSTLLKAIAGLLPLESGNVLLDGTDAAALTARQRAQQVAYLCQSRHVPDINVERLVLHGRFPHLSYPRHYSSEDHRIAWEAMEAMGLSDLAKRPLASLSGGMRQRVYIAMALAQNTPCILFDEPTTFLDIAHQIQTMELAQQLCASGKTVVMVLHDIPLALRTAHNMALVHEGRVVTSGTAEDVLFSGALPEVFGVDVGRFYAPSGWQYYYK